MRRSVLRPNCHLSRRPNDLDHFLHLEVPHPISDRKHRWWSIVGGRILLVPRMYSEHLLGWVIITDTGSQYLAGEGPVAVDGVYFAKDMPLLGHNSDTPGSVTPEERKKSSSEPGDKMV